MKTLLQQMKTVFINGAKEATAKGKSKNAYSKILQATLHFKFMSKDESNTLSKLLETTLETIKPFELVQLTLGDTTINDLTERREQRKEHRSLTHGKFLWTKIFDKLLTIDTSKMYSQRWVKLHTLLCMLQLDDPKYQNQFIEQLGEKFDTLPNPQLLQFAQNMAIAGLNQEDILDAIT